MVTDVHILVHNVTFVNSLSQKYCLKENELDKQDGVKGSKLIIYTASPFLPLISSIAIQDIPLFEDLLRSISGAKQCYLMINSPGGNADVAEKMIRMCRQRFQTFNIIVPDYAKSAATMIALGSDKIMMGYLAELGPIDPQLRTL